MPQRAEDAWVEELEDAVEFVDAVFERGAGEHEGVAAAQAFDHLGGLGAPVLDALGFVEDHQIEAQLEDFVIIKADQFVVDDLEEGIDPRTVCGGLLFDLR